MYLVELALDFGKQHLAGQGDFLTKVCSMAEVFSLHEAAPGVLRNRQGA